MRLKYKVSRRALLPAALVVVCTAVAGGASPVARASTAGHVSLLVAAGDGALRSDLRLLVDMKVLNLSLLGWPLARADVLAALEAVDPDVAAAAPWFGIYQRVRDKVSFERNGVATEMVAGEPGLLRDFDTAGRQQGNFSLAAGAGNAREATSLKLTWVSDPDDGHELRADGSDITFQLGNWLLGVNAMDRWWGAGNQSSLILSNNARPVVALQIDRAVAKPFGTRWLSWIGPWRTTAFASRLDGQRSDWPRPYFVGMRVDIRPRPWLDLGVQRTAQLCGEGRLCTAGTWLNMLLGIDNVGHDTDPGITRDTEPGNGLAGFDVRARFPGKNPLAFYAQFIGEDELDYLPIKFLGLMGLEKGGLRASGATWRAFLEYSDPTCTFQHVVSDSENLRFNCAYNASVYFASGYRQYRRSLGHTTDNDSQLIVAGFRYQPASGGDWRAKLLYGLLNRDNLTPDTLNSVAAVRTHYQAAEFGWQRDWGRQSLGLHAGVERREPLGASADTAAFGSLRWQWSVARP